MGQLRSRAEVKQHKREMANKAINDALTGPAKNRMKKRGARQRHRSRAT